MRDFLRSLNSRPRAFRWALVPIGIIASLIVSIIVDRVFAAASGPYRTSPHAPEIAIESFIAAATRTLFPAVLSPRPLPVGIIMFALDFSLRAGLPAYRALTYEYMRPRLAAAMPDIMTDVVAGVIGGLLGLYLIRRVANRE